MRRRPSLRILARGVVTRDDESDQEAAAKRITSRAKISGAVNIAE